MLMKARKSLFSNNNIGSLNNKIVVIVPILNPNEQLVIVQQNAI